MGSGGKDITEESQGKAIRDEINAIVALMGLNRVAPGRFSSLLVLEVFGGFKAGTVDPTKVASEINALEQGRTTGLKEPIQNKHPPLKGLWHKHYLENGIRSVALNVLRGLNSIGSPAFQQKIKEAEAAGETRYFTSEDVGWLVRDVTEGNLGRLRQQNRITGEWIIFAKHEEKNYYLSLATHDVSTHERVRQNIEAVCYSEFPFLRELLENEGTGYLG